MVSKISKGWPGVKDAYDGFTITQFPATRAGAIFVKADRVRGALRWVLAKAYRGQEDLAS